MTYPLDLDTPDHRCSEDCDECAEARGRLAQEAADEARRIALSKPGLCIACKAEGIATHADIDDLCYECAPVCMTCNGYGTANGKPAPVSTFAALSSGVCADCNGTGCERISAEAAAK